MSRRFPFPSFPSGWYVIGFTSDLSAGDVSTVHYFGRDIVLFRTEQGKLAAVDKTCPHLGAHLGGGKVEGECLRCPFHAWAFDTAGRCVDVPYAPKIPPKAQVRTWPLIEQNGVVLVHFGPAAPTWTPPALEQDGWTDDRRIRWELRSHPQEVGENTVDCSHLAPVHHVKKTEVLEVEQKAHVMRVLLHLVATGHVIGMPDEVNDVHLDVTLHGLGQIVSQTHVLTSGMKTRQRIHPTPIDGERIAIFAVANTKHMPDPAYTGEIDQIFWDAFTHDFAKDFPIWENKAYLERPLLASGDGPIGSYRKWARQFYTAAESSVAPSADEPKAPDSALGLVTRLALLGRDRLATLGGRWRGGGSTAKAPRTPSGEGMSESNSLLGDLGALAVQSPDPGAPQKKRFESVDAYFGTLETRFDPTAAQDLEAVFQWILTDHRELDHFAEVKLGKIQKVAGVHGAPTVTIEMSEGDYLQMINGELNGALAFSTGRGRLSGPVRLAMRMQRIFPLDH